MNAIGNRRYDRDHRFRPPIRSKYEHRYLASTLHLYLLAGTIVIRVLLISDVVSCCQTRKALFEVEAHLMSEYTDCTRTGTTLFSVPSASTRLSKSKYCFMIAKVGKK